MASKTPARKLPEKPGNLKPQWNIIKDLRIKNCFPHTITLDTDDRRKTVIRENDLAIITETKTRLINMIACKTVDKYKQNQQKAKKLV